MASEDQEQLLALLYASIDEINEDQPEAAKIEKTPDTILYGEGSVLDSIGLVRLVLLLEEKVRAASGRPIALADERAMSQRHSPFRTVGSLTAYVSALLGKTRGH